MSPPALNNNELFEKECETINKAYFNDFCDNELGDGETDADELDDFTFNKANDDDWRD